MEETFQSISDTAKWTFWRIITPVFPHVRDTLLYCGILNHEGRQKFHLGWLREGRTIEGLISHLAKNGFANHFIAWVDEDEAKSLRRLVDFHWQYHLRIFSDGEVRGHYEKTPEGNPIAHFIEQGMEERREKFLEFLGDWIVQTPSRTAGNTLSHKTPAASRGTPRRG